MGMEKSTYIGPYVRCYDSKNGDPDNWAHEEIIDRTSGERLAPANGESIGKPALWQPNCAYEGEPDFGDAVEDGGEMEIQLTSAEEYKTAFIKAFQPELDVLADYFERTEVVFGVIVTWS